MNKCNLMHRIKIIHFIGIGGSGMSGIAEVLLKQGYHVSGSDNNENAVTQHLGELGAQVFLGHDAKHIGYADVVVVSSAIAEDNPELVAAKERRIPILPRARMLAELMRFHHHGIAIAGTHGKTTTTSLVASIFAEGGLDPTFVIGGILNSAGTHAALGESNYFIAEADESDASFLYLHPTISVVTNIDADHMTTYDNDINKLRHTFTTFLHHLPFYGIAVVCIDDAGVRSILNTIARTTITYGFSEDADLQILDFVQNGLASQFKIQRKASNDTLEITLNLPGKHNALNAVAAIAVALECGVSDKAICRALTKFKGVARRMQLHGDIKIDKKRITVVDDYGHHPTEMNATIAAVRSAWPDKRLVLIFQPHRYTRVHELFADFVQALARVDVLVLLEIYSAGEKPIKGINSQALIQAIRNQLQPSPLSPIYVEKVEQLMNVLPEVLQDGDILLVQGAGSVNKIIPELMDKFGC